MLQHSTLNVEVPCWVAFQYSAITQFCRSHFYILAHCLYVLVNKHNCQFLLPTRLLHPRFWFVPRRITQTILYIPQCSCYVKLCCIWLDKLFNRTHFKAKIFFQFSKVPETAQIMQTYQLFSYIILE